MGLLTFFLFWQRVLSTNNNNNNEIVGDEAAYLIKLREAISPAPSSWFNVANMCDWSHVICGTDLDNNPCVEEINLNSMSLKGTLPSGFNNTFPYLRRLILYNNSLTRRYKPRGLLGRYICFLPPTCRPFILKKSNLTGVLPKSIGKLLKLESLHLGDQKYGGVSGTIEFLSSMTQLLAVSFERNSLEGPIPNLSNCTSLQSLMLRDNQLTGAVSLSLINLPFLTQVSLDNNWLQGPVPVFNTSITNNVSLEGNGFCLDHAGPCDHRVAFTTSRCGVWVSVSLGVHVARKQSCKAWSFITCDIQHKIRTINLTNLNLTGTISTAFGNLSDLRELHLSGNNLSGSIPESLTTLSQLKILDVSNNNLSGIIPIFSPNMVLINTAN